MVILPIIVEAGSLAEAFDEAGRVIYPLSSFGQNRKTVARFEFCGETYDVWYRYGTADNPGGFRGMRHGDPQIIDKDPTHGWVHIKSIG